MLSSARIRIPSIGFLLSGSSPTKVLTRPHLRLPTPTTEGPRAPRTGALPGSPCPEGGPSSSRPRSPALPTLLRSVPEGCTRWGGAEGMLPGTPTSGHRPRGPAPGRPGPRARRAASPPRAHGRQPAAQAPEGLGGSAAPGADPAASSLPHWSTERHREPTAGVLPPRNIVRPKRPPAGALRLRLSFCSDCAPRARGRRAGERGAGRGRGRAGGGAAAEGSRRPRSG